MGTISLNTKEKKARIGNIDIAKAIAIFFVCWLHIAKNTIPYQIDRFFSYIMGTFFMLSAYFYKPNQKYFNNVLKRIRQVIIPMLIYSALVLLLFMLFLVIRGESLEGANSFSKLIKAFFNVSYDSCSLLKIGETLGEENSYSIIVGAFWFLNRLFFAELIFFAIADWTIVSIKRLVPVVLGLIMATFLVQHLIGYHLPFQFEICFALTGIMLIGAYAKQKNLAKFIAEKYKTILYWVIVVVGVGCYWALLPLECFGSSLYAGIFSSMNNIQAWQIFPWLATTLVGSYLFLVFCTFLDKIPILSNIFKWVGRHSLVVLCFHMLIGEMLLNIFNHPKIIAVLFFPGTENPYYLTGGSKTGRFFIMLATVLICCLIAFLIDLIKKQLKDTKRKN